MRAKFFGRPSRSPCFDMCEMLSPGKTEKNEKINYKGFFAAYFAEVSIMQVTFIQSYPSCAVLLSPRPVTPPPLFYISRWYHHIRRRRRSFVISFFFLRSMIYLGKQQQRASFFPKKNPSMRFKSHRWRWLSVWHSNNSPT